MVLPWWVWALPSAIAFAILAIALIFEDRRNRR